MKVFIIGGTGTVRSIFTGMDGVFVVNPVSTTETAKAWKVAA